MSVTTPNYVCPTTSAGGLGNLGGPASGTSLVRPREPRWPGPGKLGGPASDNKNSKCFFLTDINVTQAAQINPSICFL
jgi:hypothetical protein